MAEWVRLSSTQLRGFSKEMRTLAKEMDRRGWVGRISGKGHAILRAPDGETTTALPGSASDFRSLKNARADFERWKRENPEPEVVQPEVRRSDRKPRPMRQSVGDLLLEEMQRTAAQQAAESPREEPVAAEDLPRADPSPAEESPADGFICEECGRVFERARGLSAHRRSHRPKMMCPICGKETPYLGLHMKAHRNDPAPQPDRPKKLSEKLLEMAAEAERLEAELEAMQR